MLLLPLPASPVDWMEDQGFNKVGRCVTAYYERKVAVVRMALHLLDDVSSAHKISVSYLFEFLVESAEKQTSINTDEDNRGSWL